MIVGMGQLLMESGEPEHNAVPVPEHFHEGLYIRIFFDMPKQFQKEKTFGIIGDSNYGILMGDQEADEGEIYR